MTDHAAEEIKRAPILVAAIERFLEIISEASRHVPDELKARHPKIPWRRVADLGNRLRHVYEYVEFDLIWAICVDDMDALQSAVSDLRDQAAIPDA